MHTADSVRSSPRASSRSAATSEPAAAAWLRRHTRQQHAAAEAGLDLRRLEQPAGLAGLLRSWQTVWSSVLGVVSAPGVARTARAELLVPATQSVAWLRSDLDDLHGVLGTRPARPAVDGARDAGAAEGAVVADLHRLLAEPAGSWGVAYVLRGSRLGGSMLAAQVRTAPWLPPGGATAFLSSQGTDTGRDWVAFRRRLDALALGPADLQAAGAAARWTFAWVGAVAAHGLSTQAASAPRGPDRVTSGSSP